jgi:hypothetical protein
VGAGGSLEAAYNLKASVPAGMYHFVLDSIIITPVDVTFDLIWRRGTSDTLLSSWMVHWDPTPGSFDAQAYEIDQPAQAIDFADGDKLVFRYSAGPGGTTAEAYIPNGDGALANGRIPNITLPR